MDRSRHRVAYVIGELTKGGAEYQLHELLRHLDRGLFEPRVFALASGGWWTGAIRALDVPVEEIPRRGSADLGRLSRLRAALRSFAPHLLHTILWPGNSYGRLAAVGLGIPVVVAAERVMVRYRRWQVLLERALGRMTDAYLVNCEAIASWLVEHERLAREKIHVIPNGIDLEGLPAFSLDRRAAREGAGFDPHRRLVAHAGRLEPQKDFPTYLRAAAMVAAEIRDVDFLVVGEGRERAELEALARRLGLGARVHFTGLRHDVPRLLGGVDILALTSIFEGFPNVVLEAMAAGAVAVATDVGGCRELVATGETGFLVPARAPAAVAATILRVLRDPALARRLAGTARQRVENAFGVETMAERTAAAYLRLLRAKLAPVAVAAA
ncbi:MAG TPA: GT4 family glycosyltransferase PelF [Candidatus Binatus sp.]|nr:GT4 family glycosyltransferase PelF [Candidatus Binatus sp.]